MDESDNLLLSHFPTAAVCRATRTPSECEMRSGDGLLVCQSARRRISPNDGRDSLEDQATAPNLKNNPAASEVVN